MPERTRWDALAEELLEAERKPEQKPKRQLTQAAQERLKAVVASYEPKPGQWLDLEYLRSRYSIYINGSAIVAWGVSTRRVPVHGGSPRFFLNKTVEVDFRDVQHDFMVAFATRRDNQDVKIGATVDVRVLSRGAETRVVGIVNQVKVHLDGVEVHALASEVGA